MTTAVSDYRCPVSLLVARPAVRVQASSSLREASQRMQDEGVSSALVEGHVEGILTERDITRAMAAGLGPDEPVALVAVPHPVTVSGRTPVLDAIALMLNQEIRHLVVELVDGSHGVVSLRALVAVLLQAVEPQLWMTTLRVSIGGPSDVWLG